jgi:hypothetical protein
VITKAFRFGAKSFPQFCWWQNLTQNRFVALLLEG